MLSKKQAEAASEALLDSGRHESDKNSPLLLQFPELARLPHAERREVADQARRAAWRKWYILYPALGLLILALLWVWAAITRMEAAKYLWLWPFLGSILMRQLVQRQTRRELRRVLSAIEAGDP